MWRSLTKLIAPSIKGGFPFLEGKEILIQASRTTFILKRRHDPLLNKRGKPPKKLRSKHYIYDLVKNTDCEKQPNIDVILTSYVSGLGNIGEQLNLKRNFAYTSLLLPGLAVYATPENIEKYKEYQCKEEEVVHSSPTALMTVESLSRVLLSISLNMHVPWVLKPWHIRASLRKCGIIVPEDAITLPTQSIKGPDMSLHGKQFLVTITINKTEKAKIRCRIYHYTDDVSEKIQYEEKFYMNPPEALFPEEAPELELLHQKKLAGINKINKGVTT